MLVDYRRMVDFGHDKVMLMSRITMVASIVAIPNTMFARTFVVLV